MLCRATNIYYMQCALLNFFESIYFASNLFMICARFFFRCGLYQVWSLSNRILLRNIQFPSIFDAITIMDPGEHVFYAGGRDGKIHIAALSIADSSSSKSHWLHIISSLPSHRFVIFLTDSCHKCGNLLACKFSAFEVFIAHIISTK